MITGISQNLYHIQGNFRQDKAAELSEPQKEVWKDFLIENKSTVDLGGQDRTSELTFLPSNTPWNLFSFNPCRCDSFDREINASSLETLREKDHLSAVENDLMTKEPSQSDEGSPITEDRMPELILDANLYSDSQRVEDRAPDPAEMTAQEALTAIAENPDAAIGELLAIWGPALEARDGAVSRLETALKMADAETLLAAYEADSLEALTAILGGESAAELAKPLDLDGINQHAERTDAASEIISDSTTENIVNYANELLADDSPMTSDWLIQHLGVARLISAFPEFASYLNENSDLAINFMKSLEEVKSTLEVFFNENTVEKASEFLSDDSPITDEWLAENLNASHFIATHPAFAAYLQENIEQAEKFISVSA